MLYMLLCSLISSILAICPSSLVPSSFLIVTMTLSFKSWLHLSCYEGGYVVHAAVATPQLSPTYCHRQQF